jgi:hypothetical protein
MSSHATATFELTNWTEDSYDERSGTPKLTRATVTKSLGGDLRGTTALEYLMAYREDGSADFVGLERIDGTLNDRSGTFVVEHVGSFSDGTARAQLRILAGTGTGALRGLRGDGSFVAEGGPNGTMTLDYELD